MLVHIQGSFDTVLAGYSLICLCQRWQARRNIHGLFIPINCLIKVLTRNSTRSGNIIDKASIRFGIFLLVLFAIEAALTLLPNGIVITGHEGDLLHMIDAGIRMSEGEIPHLDFMTPIGIIGFAPFAFFLSMGAAAGQAAVLANLLICLILLPATWWVGASRMTPWVAWFFGAMIIVLCTALVHGNGSISIGFSMYYNRWSWAVTLIILAALLLRSRLAKGSVWIDPAIIGVGMAMLALTKMTFFVPLVPAIILVLLNSKRYQLLLRSILVGALCGGVVVLVLGLDFVFAYAEDLLAVASGGAGRSHPGADISGVLSDPSRLSASVVLMMTIVFFRKTGKMRQGLVMLILAPAFVYITFQNWGNDPKWLYFLIIYLAMNLPKDTAKPFLGMPARQAGVVLIAIAATTALPSISSLFGSTARAAFSDRAKTAKIPLPAELADLWMIESRIHVTDRSQKFIDETIDDGEEAASINGIPLHICKVDGGFIALTHAMARQLETISEVEGKQVLTADVLNVGWLMAGQPRVDGAAIWYYDDDSGFEAADYLLVPFCPLRPDSRNAMVENIVATDWQLELRYTSELMTLYKIRRQM